MHTSSTSCTSTDDGEYELARQVFYYAQLHFPQSCKHQGVYLNCEKKRNSQTELQRRSPNWVFRPGRLVSASSSAEVPVYSGSMRDFIGCASFGRPGIRDPKNCDLLTLPPHLQGADIRILNKMISDASRGIFPELPAMNKDCCPSFPVSYRGKLCPFPVHGYEAGKLCTLGCSVVFHFLTHVVNGSIKWGVVVGFGNYDHACPIPLASSSAVKEITEKSFRANSNVTTMEVSRTVENILGVCASPEAIRRRRSTLRREVSPYGRSFNALLRSHLISVQNDRKEYIISIIDEREADKTRSARDQVGVSVIMGNDDLLRECSKNPHLAVDGTFAMVSKTSEGMDFELVSVVAKNASTGHTYSVMRQLSTKRLLHPGSSILTA